MLKNYYPGNALVNNIFVQRGFPRRGCAKARPDAEKCYVHSSNFSSSKTSGISNLPSPFFVILLNALAQPLLGFFLCSFLSLDWKIFFIV